MTYLAGADVTAALKWIERAGQRVRDIAAALRVSTSTVYRWRRGAHRPNVRNFAALRALVDDARRVLLAAERPLDRERRELAMLDEAAHELVTDEERARLDELAARVRETMIDSGALVAPAESAAELATEPEPAPYRSVTRDVDPFALVGQPVALPF